MVRRCARARARCPRPPSLRPTAANPRRGPAARRRLIAAGAGCDEALAQWCVPLGGEDSAAAEASSAAPPGSGGTVHALVQPWRLVSGAPHADFIAAMRHAIGWSVFSSPGLTESGLRSQFAHIPPAELCCYLAQLLRERVLEARACAPSLHAESPFARAGQRSAAPRAERAFFATGTVRAPAEGGGSAAFGGAAVDLGDFHWPVEQ